MGSLWFRSLIIWEESDSRWMEYSPWFLHYTSASLIASPSAIKGYATCHTVFFCWTSVVGVCIDHSSHAFLSSLGQAASDLTMNEAECWTAVIEGGRGEEPFSTLCIWSHSLAALIAVARIYTGEAEHPLKTNLLRSFHRVHRIHGKSWLDTTPVGGRQGFAQRVVHLSSNILFL